MSDNNFRFMDFLIDEWKSDLIKMQQKEIRALEYIVSMLLVIVGVLAVLLLASRAACL